jgi:predicted GIY-YIG superfamily endonuclease
LRDGHGCPSCKKSGFNPTKPAQFYIYKTNLFCGFGITNTPNTRHAEHKREFKRKNIQSELVFSLYGDGTKILNLEKEIKENFKILRQEIKGFKTEAISLNDYEMLMEFISSKK